MAEEEETHWLPFDWPEMAWVGRFDGGSKRLQQGVGSQVCLVFEVMWCRVSILEVY